MTTRRHLIRIKAPDQAAANDAVRTVYPGSGDAFVAGYAAVPDVAPITHYFCNWQMRDDEKTSLQAAFTAAGVNARFTELDRTETLRAREHVQRVLDMDGLGPVGSG